MTIWSPTIGGSKHAVIFILLIVVITIIDSQFINVFYGTNLGTPGNYHLLLYTSLVVAISIIGTLLLIYTKRNDIHPTSSRPLMFRVAHVGTSLVQYTVIAMLAIAVLEAFIVHGYNKILTLFVVYLSHFWSAIMLGIISFVFVRWLDLLDHFRF